VTGRDVSLDALLETGERIFLQKRLFNLACGSGPWDDTMPPRMREDPRDIGTDEKSLPPFEPMLAEYYKLRQWDPETGAIAADVLERLGLPQPILAPRQPLAVA
jgi:aldehyde:ferredoxin oxidoreductase